MNAGAPYADEDGPTLPANTDAEQRLIGGLFVNNLVLDLPLVQTLTADHFSEPLHGRIFETCMLLNQRGQLANPVTLKNHFCADPDLALLGGVSYLTRLLESSVSVAYADNYAKIILDMWQRRELIRVCDEAKARAFDTRVDRNNNDQLAALGRQLDDLSIGHSGGLAQISGAAKRARALANRAAQSPGKLYGLPMGLSVIDRITGGMEPKQLIIIGGRPGAGKTALAGSVTLNVAKGGGTVAVFSQEMSDVQISSRLISTLSGIPLQSMKRGTYSAEDGELLDAATAQLSALPIHMEDVANRSPSAIRSECRRLKRRHGLALVLIDHLHLMRGDAGRYQNRNAEISDITNALKGMAKELDVPVVLLSQLNRSVEAKERKDKRPTLADLRESGSIEQDADVVLFVYREAYYWRQEHKEPCRADYGNHSDWHSAHLEWEADFQLVRHKGEAILAKVRDGEPGWAPLYFDDVRLTFTSAAMGE